METDYKVNSLNGYCFRSEDLDRKVLDTAGVETLTAIKDIAEMEASPETLLERLLNAAFPGGGYNNTGDDYFVIRRGGVQYLVLVHAGQWFVGENAAVERSGELVQVKWDGRRSTCSPKEAKEYLLAALASLPKTLFPLRVLTTLEDDNGCEYGVLAPSACPGREGEYALFDLYNGPETNPCEYPVAQLREADLKALLREVAETFPASVPQQVKDLIAPDPEKRQKVWDDMDAIAEAVAEEAGQNLPYCPSIDFSVFPYLVALLFDEEQRKANGCDFLDQGDETLDTLRFLADNGRLIPTTLKGADMETYEKYIRYHEDGILDEIREDIEGYYEEYTGQKWNA